ncbi:hypothetical protein LP419_15135 [Massilia sp. H-1]|nr:hypothetical protein LP419_15135 [Massilia sp. H-1]
MSTRTCSAPCSRWCSTAGPRRASASSRSTAWKRYPATIITNLNQIKPGEQYSEAALQAFQARLQDTGYFSGVEVSTDPGEALDEEIEALEEGATARPKPPPENPVTLPVLVRVTENKQRNVALGLGFSSNTGARPRSAMTT